MKRSRTVGLGVAASVGLAIALSGTGAMSASAATCTDYYAPSYNTSTQPNSIMWCETQYVVAQNWGYTGPIDGAPGTNTWKAIQRWMKADSGYGGPVDGAPGPNTYNAMKHTVINAGYTYAVSYNGSMSTVDWQQWGKLVQQKD